MCVPCARVVDSIQHVKPRPACAFLFCVAARSPTHRRRRNGVSDKGEEPYSRLLGDCMCVCNSQTSRPASRPACALGSFCPLRWVACQLLRLGDLSPEGTRGVRSGRAQPLPPHPPSPPVCADADALSAPGSRCKDGDFLFGTQQGSAKLNFQTLFIRLFKFQCLSTYSRPLNGQMKKPLQIATINHTFNLWSYSA